MKAIVLTYDKYQKISSHMIHSYQSLWPDNPFVYRIPYQENSDLIKEIYGDKVEMIKTDSDIVSTMKGLLNDIDDNEWVYWCMDDRYPVQLEMDQVSDIYSWIMKIKDPKISGIAFSYNRSIMYSDNIVSRKLVIKDDKGQKYYRINNFRNIWFHQFIRAKVLKLLFSAFPVNMSNAKEMDYYKNNLVLPEDYNLYIRSKRLAAFGESSNRGKLTLNFVNSMKNYGLQLPTEFKILKEEIYKGSKRHEKSKMYYLLRKIYLDFKKRLN